MADSSVLIFGALSVPCYYPQANGAIERLHRHLKDTLTAKESASDWILKLPLVMLGIRSTYKQDLQCTSAELVYGTTLRLPGELISNSAETLDPATFAGILQKNMRSLQPTPNRTNKTANPFIHKDLAKSTHVFIRNDTVRKPLTPPYNGPFKVIKHNANKTYIIDINGRHDSVSIDRLKPAYLKSECKSELLNASNEKTSPVTKTNKNATKTCKSILKTSKCGNKKIPTETKKNESKPILKTSRYGRIIKPFVKFA